MSYEADDEDRSIGGAGDATQEPTTSKAIDSNEASKIANMLEGLRFPATKEQIRKYVAEGRAIALSVENARSTSRYIDDNLQDGRKYNNTYEIERALGLVVKRNKAQSRNRDRVGKKLPKKEMKKEETFPCSG
ncbi:MAG TPA: hypothetical protein VFS97_11660 [Nitrososphaeraceae archaeon]|nr:hypothetical protein [Nitrososphaeraceae archaeon]